MNARIHGHLMRLLRSSRNNTKTRNNNGRNHEFNITFEYLLELLKSQKGHCYYMKNQLLSYGSFLDYQCSLERLDPNKGYIKGNVVLCSLEMNGVSQWTVQKFQQIREQLINSKECFEYLQEIEQAQENTTNHTSKLKQLSRYKYKFNYQVQ